MTPSPVGFSRVAASNEDLTCIVGLGGQTTGTLSLNASRPATVRVVNGLLGTDVNELTDDALDGLMEVGNIIAGSLKARLADSVYHVDHITLPSIVFGPNLGVYHPRNIITASVKFEIPDLPARYVVDRYFNVTVALMKTAGG